MERENCVSKHQRRKYGVGIDCVIESNKMLKLCRSLNTHSFLSPKNMYS